MELFSYHCAWAPVQDIGAQAYGGVDFIKQWDASQGKDVQRTVYKQNSAYMLFYEVGP